MFRLRERTWIFQTTVTKTAVGRKRRALRPVTMGRSCRAQQSKTPPVAAKRVGSPTIVAPRREADAAVIAYAVECWERADGTWFYHTVPLGKGDTESRAE